MSKYSTKGQPGPTKNPPFGPGGPALNGKGIRGRCSVYPKQLRELRDFVARKASEGRVPASAGAHSAVGARAGRFESRAGAGEAPSAVPVRRFGLSGCYRLGSVA